MILLRLFKLEIHNRRAVFILLLPSSLTCENKYRGTPPYGHLAITANAFYPLRTRHMTNVSIPIYDFDHRLS